MSIDKSVAVVIKLGRRAILALVEIVLLKAVCLMRVSRSLGVHDAVVVGLGNRSGGFSWVAIG